MHFASAARIDSRPTENMSGSKDAQEALAGGDGERLVPLKDELANFVPKVRQAKRHKQEFYRLQQYDYIREATKKNVWYYRDRMSIPRGPCTLPVLRKAWVHGIIDQSTLVWGHGLIDWLPIQNVRTLVPQIRTFEVQVATAIKKHFFLKPALENARKQRAAFRTSGKSSQVLEIDFMDRAGNMIQQCPFRMLALQGPRSACRVRLCAKRAWVQTKNQDVFTAAVESGISTVLFSEQDKGASTDWKGLANFTALFNVKDKILDEEGEHVGALVKIEDGEDMEMIQSQAKDMSGILVMDATDWQIIPAENLVATFQDSNCDVYALAKTSSDAQIMLEALETGTDGVLLKTEDPKEVRDLGSYLRGKQSTISYDYEVGYVSKVEPLGMGHRVCVDLCEEMQPGEGMLIGSFSRGLFLVHSECSESKYINKRPFRVNAGAVHSYMQGPDECTGYLSEIVSGSSVLVSDSEGHCRKAIVGRVKQEVRPMVLVEAELANGDLVSVILQNAETVQLVGPSEDGAKSWRTVTVANVSKGDALFVLCQSGARHTGISVQEQIVEK